MQRLVLQLVGQGSSRRYEPFLFSTLHSTLNKNFFAFVQLLTLKHFSDLTADFLISTTILCSKLPCCYWLCAFLY
jgi:hypothetical protein